MIKTNTQNAEFSVRTPEQFKFIKPVDTAILSKIPEGGSDLTTYLIELLTFTKPEQQCNTFCFRRPKILAKLTILPQYRHKDPQRIA